MSKLSNIASRLLSRNESKLAYEVLALDSLSDSQQVANEVKYAKEWLDVLNQVFQQLEDTGEGQYLTKAKRAFEAIDPSLRKLKAVLQEWEDKATEDGDPSVVQEEWDDIAWEEDASSLIESWINGNRGDVAQACLADPDMAEDVFAGLSPEDQNGLRRRMDMERTGRRQADSGDLIQKQLGDYVQGGDWSPDPSGGRSTFISGEEDMSWLRSEHLPGLSDKFLSAIIEGNEDSPDSIEVYWAEDSIVADPSVIYVRAGEEFEDFDVEGGRQADSGDLIQKQLGDYVQGGDWSPDPSGGRSTFISGEEDMSWLRSEHLPGLSDEFLSAIIEGNEDSPDSIEVYWAEDPTVADTPVIYVRAGEEFEDFDVEGGRQAY